MMQNIKTHLQGIGKVLYVYVLAIAISWAAFPVIIVAFQQYGQLYVILSVYSAVVTFVFTCMLYLIMHGFGEMDRKPYKWARYNMKGFVCGIIAFAIIMIAEIIIIALADEYIDVRHPFFSITAINHYAKLILYMPFLWIYRIISPATEESVVPEVTEASCIIPVVFFVLAAGIGYIMGYHGIRIFKKTPTNKFLRKFLYGGPYKGKRRKAPPKEDAK